MQLLVLQTKEDSYSDQNFIHRVSELINWISLPSYHAISQFSINYFFIFKHSLFMCIHRTNAHQETFLKCDILYKKSLQKWATHSNVHSDNDVAFQGKKSTDNHFRQNWICTTWSLHKKLFILGYRSNECCWVWISMVTLISVFCLNRHCYNSFLSSENHSKS